MCSYSTHVLNMRLVYFFNVSRVISMVWPILDAAEITTTVVIHI